MFLEEEETKGNLTFKLHEFSYNMYTHTKKNVHIAHFQGDTKLKIFLIVLRIQHSLPH